MLYVLSQIALVLIIISCLSTIIRNLFKPLPPARDFALDFSNRFPVIGYKGYIPWSVAAHVYEAQIQAGVSLEPIQVIARKGGFDTDTLDRFYPIWRVETGLVQEQKARIKYLESQISVLGLNAQNDSKSVVNRLQTMHRRAQEAESRVVQLEKELQTLKAQQRSTSSAEESHG